MEAVSLQKQFVKHVWRPYDLFLEWKTVVQKHVRNRYLYKNVWGLYRLLQTCENVIQKHVWIVSFFSDTALIVSRINNVKNIVE